MSNYGVMQVKIAAEIERDDLTTPIKEAILSAIDHYESMRFWFNEKRSTASISTEFADMPTSLVEVDSIKITSGSSDYELTPRSYGYLDRITTNSTYTGPPVDYSIYAKQFRFYPIPDKTYTVTLSYINTLTDLSASVDSNDWMTIGETLIRHRAEADLRINKIGSDFAKQQALILTQGGSNTLSTQEKSALEGLQGESLKRNNLKTIRPTVF